MRHTRILKNLISKNPMVQIFFDCHTDTSYGTCHIQRLSMKYFSSCSDVASGGVWNIRKTRSSNRIPFSDLFLLSLGRSHQDRGAAQSAQSSGSFLQARCLQRFPGQDSSRGDICDGDQDIEI